MAFTANAVGRVRAGGDDANGAFFDASISGAGTDYSDQDSPQLSVTDLACSNTTTVTSATGGFTSAMVGNAVRVAGGGATSGYYFITARASTNSVTVDRSPGTVSGGAGKVGGAAATDKRLCDSANATGDKCVAGNRILIRGSGSDDPATADYDFTAGTFFTPVDGCEIAGVNGRPTILTYGLRYYNSTNGTFANLFLRPTGTGNITLGAIKGASPSLKRVRVDANGQAGSVCVALTGYPVIEECLLENAASDGIYFDGFYCVVSRTVVRNNGGHGANAKHVTASESFFLDNGGDGVRVWDGQFGTTVLGCTIDGNGGNGVSVAATTANVDVRGNLITNQTGVGKHAISYDSATFTPNAAGNFLYNNADNSVHNNPHPSNVNTVLAGDPYVDRSGGDYSLNDGAGAGADVRAGRSLAFPGLSTTTYRSGGAAQEQAAGGGGGGTAAVFSRIRTGY